MTKEIHSNDKLKNYAIALRFDGSVFHGWQSQKNAITIQDTVSKSIKKATGEDPFPELVGCGRTDAGVHGLEFIANFKSSMKIPPGRFPLAMLQFLPKEISIMQAAEVPMDFHSRFSCLKKEYIYKIYHSKIPDPFMNDRAAFHPLPLDVDKMRSAAGYLLGTKDFTAFRAAGSQVKTTVRTIYSCQINGGKEEVEINICADGFLYNMVRIIAGTLLYVSDGKIAIDEISEIIQDRDRKKAGITMGPEGLYFNRAWYSEKPGIMGIV